MRITQYLKYLALFPLMLFVICGGAKAQSIVTGAINGTVQMSKAKNRSSIIPKVELWTRSRSYPFSQGKQIWTLTSSSRDELTCCANARKQPVPL